jgi:hypothetical protein
MRRLALPLSSALEGNMAVSRYIEIKASETWATVSEQFGAWVLENDHAKNFGWSEGDPISLENGIVMACFKIPDRQGEKIAYFEQWAASTGRIYGIAEGRQVKFPRKPELNVLLPPPKELPIPPWLK